MTKSSSLTTEVPEAGAQGRRWDPPVTLYDKQIHFTMKIILLARRYRALLDDRLRPLGYGTARMEALSTIARTATPTAQIEIAKKIGIEGPTLTRMLDALEAEGLVTRQPDPCDRRAKFIELTDAGRQGLAKITRIADALRAEVLAELTIDDLDAANETTGKVLRTLNDNFPR